MPQSAENFTKAVSFTPFVNLSIDSFGPLLFFLIARLNDDIFEVLILPLSENEEAFVLLGFGLL